MFDDQPDELMRSHNLPAPGVLPGFGIDLPDPFVGSLCNGMSFADSEVLFFPKDNIDKGHKAANFCAPCPVKERCAEFGRTLSDGVGIWGGYVGGDPNYRDYADGRSKLQPEDVHGIRARVDAGGETKRQIAKAYGISTDTVREIGLRNRWTHLPERAAA